MPFKAERRGYEGKIGSICGSWARNVLPAERGDGTRGTSPGPPLLKAPPLPLLLQLRPAASRRERFFDWHPAARFPLHTKKWPLSGGGGSRYRHKMEDAGRRQQVSPPPPPSSAARARLAPDTKEPLVLRLPPQAWDAPGGGLEALEPSRVEARLSP